MLIRSTPVRAIAATVSSVTPPEASRSTPGAPRITQLDGSTELIRVHIIEQHDFRPAAQRVGELFERVDFDLDADPGGRPLSGRFDRLGNGAAFGPGGEVVVFDQHAVVEPHPVIRTAAAADSVFLQGPPAGQRFASVENLRTRPRGRVDELSRQRGDPAQMRQKVEHRPFAGQQ